MLEIDVGAFTFYWRMTESVGAPANPVPDKVDFTLAFREDVQLIIQKRNADTINYLERIYQEEYNVGYLQEGHDLAASYGGDFLNFIHAAIARHAPHAKSVAEIGAGGCYVLKQLKEAGYNARAVDPSPICHHKAAEYGIDVVPSFYPAPGSIPKSDIILHYDVLEHVEEPSDFLRHHRDDLAEGGIVLFAVPDCTPYIERGDISMLLHEHLNYYDAASLAHVVYAAGLEVLEITPSNHGSVLYCAARAHSVPVPWVPHTGFKKFEQFSAHYHAIRQSIDAFIQQASGQDATLGCYVPLRTFPYLGNVNSLKNMRFFDDNASIYGQYFDGYAQPVENMQDLIARPVTHLLILSFAFGDKIRQKIQTLAPNHTMNIWCLSDYTG
jgi:2-polyprenyl-3-methyl-5-hydroxy-6-metoxy-1,4-benzoquinol methylase